MKPLLVNGGIVSGGCFFSGLHLSRESECVDQKKLSKARQLSNLSISQLVVVMCPLISIQSDQVSPFFEVLRQFSGVVERVDSSGKIFPGQRRIKGASRNVHRLPIHGGSGIAVSFFLVFFGLDKCSLRGIRNAFWGGDRRRFWVNGFYLDNSVRAMNICLCIEIASAVNNPSYVSILSEKPDSNHVLAPIAGPCNGPYARITRFDKAFKFECVVLSKTVGTISNQGDSHE